MAGARDCTPSKIYPAHAGINRADTTGSRVTGHLPRTRGDKPGLGDSLTRNMESTPHTRG